MSMTALIDSSHSWVSRGLDRCAVLLSTGSLVFPVLRAHALSVKYVWMRKCNALVQLHSWLHRDCVCSRRSTFVWDVAMGARREGLVWLLVCLGRTFKSACLGLSISKLSLCVYLRCCIVLGVWTMFAFLTLFLNVYRRCSIRWPPILGAAGGSCVRCVCDEWFSCFIRLMHTCWYRRCDGFARMIGACLYF